MSTTGTTAPVATTTSAPTTLHQPTRLAVASWVVYDLANTIFSMAIVSLDFSLWVRDQVGVTMFDKVYGITMAISMAIIFALSPLLGALTDQARRRMPFLITSTLICVTLTFFLGQGGLYTSLLLFIIANVAYQATVQFYDSLLPEVSNEANRGKISGIGVGVGYLGSYIGVGTSLVLTNQSWGFGYPREVVFPAVAVLFLLFALPCFFFVKERGNPRAKPFGWNSVKRALAQSKETFKHAGEYPGLVRFLIGRLFYTDAVNTVIAIMSVYVVNQVVRAGFPENEGETIARFILLGSITFAVLGGFSWGWLVDRIGPKRTLDYVLYVWIATALLAALVGLLGLPIWVFYMVAAGAGIGFGGLWAADRPYMLRLTPPARVGEFYGLYGMVGRFAAIIGPLIWAFVVGFLLRGNPYAQPIGVLMLLAMLIIGYVILRPVSDAPRQWSAEERGEA